MRHDDQRVKDFHKKVIILSRKRSQRDAYAIAERGQKHREGKRLYKNYNSYKSSISKRRKSGKI